MLAASYFQHSRSWRQGKEAEGLAAEEILMSPASVPVPTANQRPISCSRTRTRDDRWSQCVRVIEAARTEWTLSAWLAPIVTWLGLPFRRAASRKMHSASSDSDWPWTGPSRHQPRGRIVYRVLRGQTSYKRRASWLCLTARWSWAAWGKRWLRCATP